MTPPAVDPVDNDFMPTHRHGAAPLLARLADVWIATPQVMAIRLSRMALSGHNPSAADRAEMQRMVSEKVLAASQSWMAICMSWWLMPLRLAPAWNRSLRGDARSHRRMRAAAGRASTDLIAAGLAPVRSVVVANAKRLSRQRKPAGR